MSILIKHKKLILVIKIFLMLAIFWLLAKYAQLNLSLLFTLVSHPLPSIFIIALCLLMVVIQAWRWFKLNSAQQLHLTYMQTLIPTYIGVAYNNFLPGSVGGDFYRIYSIIKRFPHLKSRCVLTIFVDRLIGLIGIFLVGGICILCCYPALRNNTDMHFFLFILSAIGIFFFFIVIAFLGTSIKKISWLTSKINQYKFSVIINELLAALKIFWHSKLITFISLLVSVSTQILLLIVVIILVQMMQLPPLPLPDYLLALVVAQIANLLPLTPGGIGVGEVAFVNTLLIINPDITAPYATVFLALRLLVALSNFPGLLLAPFLLIKKFDNI